MNYDRVGAGERLCSTREDSRRANETQGGAPRRASFGRVIIYELWWRRSTVGGNIVMNMLSSPRPLVESTSASAARGTPPVAFLFLYWHSDMHVLSGDALNVIFCLPGEISRTDERSHRAFGMQIQETVVCKRTYATHAVQAPAMRPKYSDVSCIISICISAWL